MRRSDVRTLEVLFAGLDTTWFRPHDLGPAGARAVADHVGRDAYLIGFLDQQPVGYGMLRGWDEGYQVPSLGIAVREGYRGQGLGRQMMQALHAVVRERGGHRVRLRVAPGNARARRLYDSMGYRQVGVERGELVQVLDLGLEGRRPLAMPRRLTGTREKSYRVGTADEVAAWVVDETETLTDGWIPLFSERRPDSTLRVLYGRLPDDMITPKEARLPEPPPAGLSTASRHRPHIDAVLGGIAMLLTVLGVAVAFGLLAHP